MSSLICSLAGLPSRWLAAHYSSCDAGNRLCILTYHRILEERDPLRPYEPWAALFAKQLAILQSAFTLMRLDEAVHRLTDGRLPRRAVAITFDDGYLDNHSVALPLLRQAKVPATVFVATGFLEGGAMFNDLIIEAVRVAPGPCIELPDLLEQPLPIGDLDQRRSAIGVLLGKIKALPLARRGELARAIAARLGLRRAVEPMMKPDHVRDLHRQGIEIGAHTVRHPILASLSREEADREIAESARALRGILDAPVEGFAYPNGRPGQDYGPEHVDSVARAGFRYAVSTRWASAAPGMPVYELPRVAPWSESPVGFALRVARSFAA